MAETETCACCDRGATFRCDDFVVTEYFCGTHAEDCCEPLDGEDEG
jgi:hypothetical protein